MTLLQSYLRRKKFEAKLLAVEVGKLFSGGGQQGQRVSPDQMLGELGIVL